MHPRAIRTRYQQKDILMYFPLRSQETENARMKIEGILRYFSILRSPMIIDSAMNSKLLYLICQFNYAHTTHTLVSNKCPQTNTIM